MQQNNIQTLLQKKADAVEFDKALIDKANQIKADAKANKPTANKVAKKANNKPATKAAKAAKAKAAKPATKASTSPKISPQWFAEARTVKAADFVLLLAVALVYGTSTKAKAGTLLARFTFGSNSSFKVAGLAGTVIYLYKHNCRSSKSKKVELAVSRLSACLKAAADIEVDALGASAVELGTLIYPGKAVEQYARGAARYLAHLVGSGMLSAPNPGVGWPVQTLRWLKAAADIDLGEMAIVGKGKSKKWLLTITK